MSVGLLAKFRTQKTIQDYTNRCAPDADLQGPRNQASQDHHAWAAGSCCCSWPSS
jgi:hypothetical protein